MNHAIVSLLQQADRALRADDLTSAEKLLQQVLLHQPGNFDALQMMGMVHGMRGQPREAVKLFRKALKLNASNPFLHLNLAKALHESGQQEEGLKHSEAAIRLAPQHAEAWTSRGLALHELKRYADALVSYEQALRLDPQLAEAWCNAGNTLSALRRWGEAKGAFERALALNPGFPAAWSNRANALQEMKLPQQALESVENALRLQPDLAVAWSNRGNILQDLKRYAEALESFDRALALAPNYAEGWVNRGNTLRLVKKFKESLASYERALQLDANIPYAAGHQLNAKMAVCDWAGLDEVIAGVKRLVNGGGRVIEPFAFLAIDSTPAEQQQCAAIYAQDKYPLSALAAEPPRIGAVGKIRIGYFSADFHNHATSYLMAGLFEKHDREKFEVVGFSFGPAQQDQMRERLLQGFDRFIEIGDLSDEDAARMARELGIDIAVDLKGFTQDCRTGIFARRAAPVQVNYLGYPGSMGADYMDYLVADPVVIPAAERAHYSEKVVWLPHSYQVNDSARAISGRPFSRREQGLPEHGFVFCCFNNNYKITPDVFAIWMRLLQRVEGSVLWLLQDNADAADNLRREAQARGVAAERLVFAPRAPLADHLARQRLADLFLDTFHYNAHTTASDALWAGLPVLTRCGGSFPARVAASLLQAVGLPELVTHSAEEYERLALELAADANRLGALRDKLAANRLSQPLFDTELFTRHLEDAYGQMVERCRQGLAPSHLEISARE